jgi:geranylgeranyl pyrophosphate synthase
MLFEFILILILILLFISTFKINIIIDIKNENENVNGNVNGNNDIDNLIDNDLNERIKYLEMNEICKYATKGGKHIRSKIIKELSLNENELNENNLTNHAILFIEYLHSSSLILDDIMDQDIERRGKQCVYIKYGIVLAQMSSILLLSIAMQHLNIITKSLNNEKAQYISNLFTDNFYKLALGQYLDISNIKNQEDIDLLIQYKTSSLYELSFQLGYLINSDKLNSDKLNSDKLNSDKLNSDKLNLLKEAGIIYGKIFQLKDDFEDVDKDKINKADINYILVHGKDKAIKKLNELNLQIKDILNKISQSLYNKFILNNLL